MEARIPATFAERVNSRGPRLDQMIDPCYRPEISGISVLVAT